MKICPCCGQQNSDEIRFCGKCGKELLAPQKEPIGHEMETSQQETVQASDTAAVVDQTKKSKKKYILIPVVLILVIAAGVIFAVFGYPYIRYQQALDDLEAGNYSVARETFVELGDYKDSPACITEADYQIAKQTAETDLIEGLTLLRNMGAYKDSQELVTAQKNKILEEAKNKISGHAFEEAEGYLNAIPDLEGVAELRKELTYQSGLDYESKCDYGEAKKEFEKIHGYKDVDEKLNTLQYQLDGTFISGQATAYAFYAWNINFNQDSGRLRTSRMSGYSPVTARTYDQTYFYWIQDNIIYGIKTLNDDYSTRPSQKPTEEIGRITDVRRDENGKIDAVQISGLFSDEPVWFD